MEGVLSKSTDDAKLGTMVDASRNWVAIWTDLNRQEKWADKNLRKFKDECKDLSLFRNNPTQRDTLSNGSKAALQSKTWVSWGQAEHDTATCPYGKGSQPNPGLYEQECTQQVENDDYSPIIQKLHLGAPYSVLGFPAQEKHWHTEQVQQGSRSLKYVTHQERLREPGLFSLQRRPRGDPIAAFSQLMGRYREGVRLFLEVPSKLMRSSSHKWQKEKFQLASMKEKKTHG